MAGTHETENEQQRRWNGAAGRAWVEAQDLLDRIFKPFEALLVDAVSAADRRRVLDVGCGTGGTTLAVARSLGSTGGVVGIDISDPMITAARARAQREGTAARFVCANAEDHPFDPASFDMIVSRFGVMFFHDPIRAFGNLRRALTEDADLRCIVWRSAGENPFMTTAEEAAAPLLPNLPARRPGEPGQLAFADGARVRSILEASGWIGIDIRPIDVACTLPEKDLVDYLTRLGPVGMALQEADDSARARVIETVRPAFDRYVHGDEVRFTAGCWSVGARTR